MCGVGAFAASCLLFFPGVAADAQEDVGCEFPLVHQADVVATVNGHEITIPEFRRSLLEHRAAVFGYFNRQW